MTLYVAYALERLLSRRASCNVRRGRIICDAVNDARFIIAEVKSPIATNGQSDGTANSSIAVDKPACRKILRWTAYPAAGVQGNKDDLMKPWRQV